VKSHGVYLKATQLAPAIAAVMVIDITKDSTISFAHSQ
jgi:hypothetical protein